MTPCQISRLSRRARAVWNAIFAVALGLGGAWLLTAFLDRSLVLL